MKKFSKKILSFIACLIPIKILIKITGINVIYPFYHIISDNSPAHIKHLYSVKTEKKFRKDLDFLTKHFTPTTEIISELKSKKNFFHISFDDGLRECQSIIAPILKEYNIKASFFINSGFADNKDLFFRYKASIIIDKIKTKNLSDEKRKQIFKIINTIKEAQKEKLIDLPSTRSGYEKDILKIDYKNQNKLKEIAKILNINFENYLKENKPYLSKKQINELINEGHKIGSHSINHPLFSEINEDEQIFQTSESMKFINNNFNIDYKLFAFPFTDDKVSETFFKKVFSKNIIDYSFGTAGIKKDAVKNNIQRIPIESKTISAKKYIKTEYLLYFIKKIFKKHIIYR